MRADEGDVEKERAVLVPLEEVDRVIGEERVGVALRRFELPAIPQLGGEFLPGVDGVGETGDSSSMNGKPRRKYPRVLPKYRNPQTSETWSGRGKRPRWLVAAMKSGHKIEEFKISDGGSRRRQVA